MKLIVRVFNAKDYSLEFLLANPYLKALNNLSFEHDDWRLSNKKLGAYAIFPYEEEFEDAKQSFLGICKALMERGALAGAIMLYCGVMTVLSNKNYKQNEKIKIAFDSSLARNVPMFYENLKENLEKFLPVKVDLVLLYPRGQITVPLLGAFNAIRKY